MTNLIKEDLKRYYMYIGSYLVIIYAGLFTLDLLGSFFQDSGSGFLDYVTGFIYAFVVILLIVSTLFNVFYFSTSPTFVVNKNANIYYRVLGYNVYIIFIIINFIICSALFFNFDIMSLFKFSLQTYIGTLFAIVPVNNLLICIYLKITENQFIKNKLHIAMLAMTFILIFVSGYGYYFGYYQIAGYGLILSLVPLAVTFRQCLKSRVFELTMLALILMLLPINLVNGENNLDSYYGENNSEKVDTYEDVTTSTFTVTDVNTVFGAMKSYQSDEFAEEMIYVNDDYNITTSGNEFITVEIKNENPLLNSTVNISKYEKEYSFDIDENTVVESNKIQNCNGSYTYDGLIKSTNVSSEIKNVVKVLAKNDYQILDDN